MEDKRVKALVKLLEDPNEVVFQAVRKALQKEDKHALPLLEEAWELTDDETFRQRLDDIIHYIQLSTVRLDLKEWMDNGADDLLYGSFLIAKYRYADLLYATINERVNSLWREIRHDIKNCKTPLDRIKCINETLFDKHGYIRNNANPTSHRNNYINDVIDSHKGNHITMSILYSALCRRLNIPVRCVSLPRIVILCYLDESAIYDEDITDPSSVLFYINTICKGAVLCKNEIDIFLDQQNINKELRYYLPCTNVEVMRRLLNNLSYTYDMIGNGETVREIQGLLNIFDK